DASRFGGKAASLAVLCQAKLLVPSGIALDVNAAASIAAGDRAHIERLRQALTDRPGPFAVRSSATAEDSSAASFAGQFKTVLGASDFEEVVAAVKEVWM